MYLDARQNDITYRGRESLVRKGEACDSPNCISELFGGSETKPDSSWKEKDEVHSANKAICAKRINADQRSVSASGRHS